MYSDVKINFIRNDHETTTTLITKKIDVLDKFEIIRTINIGIQGTVFVAKLDNEPVIIKRTSSDGYYFVMALNEICFMNNINSIHIPKIKDIIWNDDYIYTVVENRGINLHQYILENPSLTTIERKKIMFQLFSALNDIHKTYVIHSDVKPENIIVGHDIVSLIDFGISKSSNSTIRSNSVYTLWYRPPEILLGSKYYTRKADIWAAAMVCAEIELGYPIVSENNYYRQLGGIILTIGMPSERDIKDFKQLPKFDAILGDGCFDNMDNNRNWQSYGQKHQLDPQLIDLLYHCFQYNISCRFDAKNALSHPFFDDVREGMHVNLNYPDCKSISNYIPQYLTLDNYNRRRDIIDILILQLSKSFQLADINAFFKKVYIVDRFYGQKYSYEPNVIAAIDAIVDSFFRDANSILKLPDSIKKDIGRVMNKNNYIVPLDTIFEKFITDSRFRGNRSSIFIIFVMISLAHMPDLMYSCNNIADIIFDMVDKRSLTGNDKKIAGQLRFNIRFTKIASMIYRVALFKSLEITPDIIKLNI